MRTANVVPFTVISSVRPPRPASAVIYVSNYLPEIVVSLVSIAIPYSTESVKVAQAHDTGPNNLRSYLCRPAPPGIMTSKITRRESCESQKLSHPLPERPVGRAKRDAPYSKALTLLQLCADTQAT